MNEMHTFWVKCAHFIAFHLRKLKVEMQVKCNEMYVELQMKCNEVEMQVKCKLKCNKMHKSLQIVEESNQGVIKEDSI